MKPIKHIKIKENMTVSNLVESFSDLGFQAKKISQAKEILNKIKKQRKNNLKLFLGVAGAMVPCGMKNIILDMLDYTDVFVTTGANLTHDLIEALGNSHYQGDDKADDSDLNKKGIDRIYNVFMKSEVYQTLEDFFDRIYSNLPEKMNIKEFLWELGKNIPKEKANESILRKCYEKKIPIFCPGISDSGIGLMIWGQKTKQENKNKQIKVDVFDDLNEIIDIAWTTKEKAIFYIGGGVPKNYIQQAMQFSSPASYGIQITMDREETGGSSGAKLKEGISWGKMSEKGEFVNVYCPAEIALPLILS